MFLILSLLIVVGVVFLYRTTQLNEKLKHLPTFPSLPIIGHAHLLLFCDYIGLYKLIQRATEILETETRKLPFLLRIGPINFFFSSDPDEVILYTNAFINKPYFFGFSKEWLRNGTITAPGDIWKKNVKIVAMSYTSNALNANLGLFNDQARELVNNLKLKINSGYIDIMEDVSATAFRTIYRVATGKTQGSNTNTFSNYSKAINKVLVLLLNRVFKVLYHSDHIYRLTPEYREYMKHVLVMRDIFDTLIETRIEERKMMHMKTENFTGDGSNYQSLLDHLITIHETDPTFSLNQVQDEIHTIIGAGFDTLSSSLLFTLALLAKNPDIQEKLYIEIKSIMGDSVRNAEKEDLNQMPYCDAVITESLRLFPPVPLAFRQADRNIDFENYTVRKGDVCAINAYGIGHSRRLWGEDAKCFRPERWLNREIPNTATSTFNLGKRSCLGKKYALMTLKVVLIHCIKELILVGEDRELEPSYEVVLKPGRGHLMKIHQRVP